MSRQAIFSRDSQSGYSSRIDAAVRAESSTVSIESLHSDGRVEAVRRIHTVPEHMISSHPYRFLHSDAQRRRKRAAPGPPQTRRGQSEIVIASSRKYLLDPNPDIASHESGPPRSA